MKLGRKLEYLEKIPDEEFQKCDILKPEIQALAETWTCNQALVAG